MRKLFLIAFVLLLVLAASAGIGAVKADSSPVISIYNTTGMKVEKKPVDPTVVKVYSDGRMVWSKNGIRGGEPLVNAQVDPKLIRKLISKLDKQGSFTDKTLERAWVGLDASSTIIEVRDGKKILRMQSWHELFETNPKLVATATGVRVLGNKSREEILKAQPKDYKHFREVWGLIRKTVDSWKAR